MAKAKTSKPARGRKLKVYRTPIGFHDAYVAAPTQKAALEAWGAGSNLFGRGDAEQVSDPELMAAPLERPGEVIKVLRGSRKEQVEALGKAGAQRARKRPSPRARPVKGKGRRPSRAALDKAEKALTELNEKHEAQLARLADEERKLAERRREAERDHARRREELEERLAGAKAEYERAVREREGGG